MSTEKVKLILNNVLLALQFCLGVWQFMKLTLVGAFIQGVAGWLLRPLGFSPTYDRLQHCPGRVFKRAYCFTLQTDIPSERRDIRRNEVDTIKLDYLGIQSLLERKGTDGNMLFVNKKMCFYITRTIWDELQTLEDVLSYGLDGPSIVRADVARARAEQLDAAAAIITRAAAESHLAAAVDAVVVDLAAAAARDAAFAAAAAAAAAGNSGAINLVTAAEAAVAAAEAIADCPSMHLDAAATCDRYIMDAAATAARAAARATFNAARAANSTAQTLFVQGNRQFWKGMITGGVMTLDDIFDAIILYNHHVSVRLNNDWLLPVNLSVSEERLLKILNLIALFLQTGKVEVHWLIPTSLSIISALLEFSTKVRVLLYTKINMLFCYIVHFICDPLPYAWRQQVYSLGKWVENLTPCNDIQLKVVRGNISAIITEGAKVDQEGAVLVSWLSVPDEKEGTLKFGFIEKKFPCNPTHITCTYLTRKQVCEISAPRISEFYVKCKNDDDFSHIITFVSCIAENRCGSLISYGPNKKVRVRGFEESITSYVDNGLPSVYTLELANVVVA